MILFLIKLSQNETIFDFQDQEEELANQSEYYNQDKGKEEETNNIEDHYDYRQTYLKAMLDSVSGESIKETWHITPYIFTNSYQHIIIFKDGTHLYTCLLLVSHGIICRHYFKLMAENSNALFYVLLIPTRWLQDDVWDRVNEIFNEPFIESSSKNSKQLQDHGTVQ